MDTELEVIKSQIETFEEAISKCVFIIKFDKVFKFVYYPIPSDRNRIFTAKEHYQNIKSRRAYVKALSGEDISKLFFDKRDTEYLEEIYALPNYYEGNAFILLRSSYKKFENESYEDYLGLLKKKYAVISDIIKKCEDCNN